MAEAAHLAISDTGGLTRKAAVRVSAAQFEAEVNAGLRQAAVDLKVPGFRPGKVPMKEVRRRLEGQVRDRVAREMSIASFTDAMRGQPFTLAAPATIEIVSLAAGGDLAFTATFEVLPEIELAPWASLRIRQPHTAIEEPDIDATIEDIRLQRRVWTSVDRPAATGDRITLDYQVRRGDMVLTDRSGVVAVLGEGRLGPLEQALVGLAADEATTVATPLQEPDTDAAEKPAGLEDGALLDAPAPDPVVEGEAATPEVQGAEGAAEEPSDATNAESASEDAGDASGETERPAEETVVAVTMRAVEQGELPAVDDALFDWFGVEPDGDRAAKFRAAVRERMDAEAQDALRRATRLEMRNVLARAHDFDLPASALAAELESLGDFEDASETARLAARLLAENRLRARLVMREIVKRESLRPDNARVRARIDRIASAYEEAAEVRQLLMTDERRLGEVQGLVLEEQVFEHVLAHAQVVPVAMPYRSLVAGESMPELPPEPTDIAPAQTPESEDEPAPSEPSARRRGLLGGLRRLFAG